MAISLTFTQRLSRVLIPTSVQAFGAVFLSMTAIFFMQSQSLITHLGISPAAIDVTQHQFQDRFQTILRSSLASNLALITFWSAVGLAAYLVFWGLYNVFLEARNEVALNTEYTNRAHWHGPWQTLILKTISALLLVAWLATFGYGVSLWFALSSDIINYQGWITLSQTFLGVVGFSVQLYLTLALVQLTFTPWYSD